MEAQAHRVAQQTLRCYAKRANAAPTLCAKLVASLEHEFWQQDDGTLRLLIGSLSLAD